ncbi:hypothetical protein [Pseudomonas putida]|uniref:hypothetical protein n=1 Tax=Pseudomonas putida TaxID=303 RepID=UPI003F8A12DE
MDWLEIAQTNKDAFLALAAIGAFLMTGITALLSFIGLIKSKRIDMQIKEQETVRKFLEDGMIGLGEKMHEVLATATILVTKFENPPLQHHPEYITSIQKHKARIDSDKKHLIKAKAVYRYKLYGMEEGIAIIARVGDWVKGLNNNIPLARKLLKEADEVRKSIDRELLKCYRKGTYPSWWSKRRVNRRVKKIRLLWDRRNI